MAVSTQLADPQVSQSRQLLERLVDGYGPRNFAVKFWDGSTWEPDAGQETAFTLIIHHAGSMRSMFWPPSPLSFAQAYLYNDFDVEGDMVVFTHFCRFLSFTKKRLSPLQRYALGYRIWRMPKREQTRSGRQQAKLSGEVHSIERDRQAISYHYDTSNEFFETALGPRLVYTSGVWNSADEDLETAQTRKFEILFQKLRLKPGERLLDIGCGWGAAIMHAAQQYGAQCVGVTLSNKQAEWARAKIEAAGLSDRCEVRVQDYRELPDSEQFDKIVMMEVGEHFGAEQFDPYFKKCFRLLRPGGALAIQQITLFGHEGSPGARVFSHNYVFPDGELVPVSVLCRDAEKAGFDVRDVESFREHYPQTLKHWLSNVETNHDAIVALTDEATYRTFRLYFAGARLGFETNVYNLHHLLVVKPLPDGTSDYPLARSMWRTGS